MRLAAVPVALVSTIADGVPNAGVTRVGELARTTAPVPVEVVPPVPPLATARVPANVIVPEPVTGPPDVVRPVVPPETSIEITPSVACVSIISLVPATDGNTVSSVPATFSAEVDCSTKPASVKEADLVPIRGTRPEVVPVFTAAAVPESDISESVIGSTVMVCPLRLRYVPVPAKVTSVELSVPAASTPIEERRVAPLSATGLVVPSPTIISPSAKTAIAVIAPVPLPSNTPPLVKVDAPVPPSETARLVVSDNDVAVSAPLPNVPVVTRLLSPNEIAPLESTIEPAPIVSVPAVNVSVQTLSQRTPVEPRLSVESVSDRMSPPTVVTPVTDKVGIVTVPANVGLAELDLVAIATAMLSYSVSISVPFMILSGSPVGNESFVAKSTSFV